MARTALENPYTPDAGAAPPALTGRDAELEHLQLLLGRLASGRSEKSMIVTGMRGVGKTVLLNRFELLAQEMDPQWYTEAVEVSRTTRLSDTMARVCRRLLLRMSRTQRMRSRAVQALGVLKSFTATVEGVEFSLDVEALLGTADSGNLAEDLRDLLVEVGEVAQNGGTGALLLFDEVQLLNMVEYEALILALHRVKQRGLPLAFVGAGLPLLPALTGEAKSYAERMFRYPRIGALPPQAAKDALIVPARREGIEYEPDALDRILELSEGYPYFLQEYGKHVWICSKNSTVTFIEVEQVAPDVQLYLDENFFDVRMGKLSKGDQKYMAALADLGDGPQESSEVARKLNRRVNQVSMTRDRIMKANLIFAPRLGYVDFTVPHCADYIRRNFPFSDIE